MTRLFWIRHGPTHQKAFTGWRDVPADLSDIAALARLEAGLPKDAKVTSSDLTRATATADAIQGDRHRMKQNPNFREFNFGEWDGLKWDEVASRDPQLSRLYWESPGDHTPPGGESWNDASQRISRAVDQLIETHPKSNIVIVAHIGTILTQLCRAKKLTPYQALAQQIDNLSLTETFWDGSDWSIGRVNHLF